MAAYDEEAAVSRTLTLSTARRLASEWGYWCFYGRLGDVGGRRPHLHASGMERRYRSPPQWHPPEPRMPEADENVGIAVQRAFIRLPEARGFPFRSIIRAEFCVRPWVVALDVGELEVAIARKAGVSIGAYDQTLERALLSLANLLKRHGGWPE